MTEPVAVANMADDLPMETAELHVLRQGTNIRSGWVITCAGPGHPQTVALATQMAREQLHKNAAIERAQVNGRKWKGDDDITPEESGRKIVANYVKRIVTWTPVDFGQGPIAFSEANAIALFMDQNKGDYFRQLVDFITGEQSFMKASASN